MTDYDDRDFDLVVYGATGFVGRIICEYLTTLQGSETHGPEAAAGGLRWAVAGRSMAKLEALRASLGDRAGTVPVLVADAADQSALAKICGSTRGVIATAGPYAHHGEGVLRACTEAGTDYCDLAGELQWIRRMLHYDGPARASGARILHCCGFDSLPSDLGVYHLQQEILARFGEPATSVKMRVSAMRGGVSGGTVASIMNVFEEAATNRALRRELEDPYSLCPDDGGPRNPQPGLAGWHFDADLGAWSAPFLMAAINTRVVLRSHALAGYPYGNDFRYDEAMLTGPGFGGHAGAAGTVAATGALFAMAALPPTRWLLRRFLPKPGEGPARTVRDKGFWRLEFVGKTASGDRLHTRVTGDSDPGYGSTAKMLAQAAICLVKDLPRSEQAGGSWTPAALFGDLLFDRLRRDAGMTFEVVA